MSDTAKIDKPGSEASSENGLPEGVPADGSVDYRLLFEQSNEPQYLLDTDDHTFTEVNPAFERLTGYTRDELVNGRMTSQSLIAGESASTYQTKVAHRKDRPSERYEIRLVRKDGTKIPVEVSVRKCDTTEGTFIIGVVRDVSEQKKLEQEMWDKIQNLGYASNRVYALTEKIRIVPDLTNLLLHSVDERDLLEKAASKLCDRQGLGYGSVSFFLTDGDVLELSYTTKKETEDIRGKKRRFALDGDSRYAKILRGEQPPVMTPTEAILPLQGRDHPQGIVEVLFHPKEIAAFKGNDRALKGYQDILETLSNLLGLLIENLRLYDIVKRQSVTDQLTGIYNRRFFDVKLADEVGRAARYNRQLAILLIDVDKFKTINDVYGHQQGDIVLVEAARLLKASTREVDVVSRYGGDEFVVLMPETPLEGAILKAESLRKTVEEHVFPSVLSGETPIKVTFSIGVSVFSPAMKGPDHFLKAADEAMYASKKEGRNRVTSKTV